MKSIKAITVTAGIIVSSLLPAQGWKSVYQGTGASGANVHGIEADFDGNTVSCGTYQSSTGMTMGAFTLASYGSTGADMFLAKHDAAGNCLWARRAGSTAGGEDMMDVALDPSGNIYVCGTFQGTANFTGISNSFNIVSSGSYDGFIAKYDANGECLWAKNICSSIYSNSNESAKKIVFYSTQILVAGSAGGPATITGGNSVALGAYLASFDLNGNWQWNYNFANYTTGTTVNPTYDDIGLAVGPSRQVAVCSRAGISSNTQGNNQTIAVSNSSKNSILYAKYDVTGHLFWSRMASSASTVDAYGSAVDFTPDGNYIVLTGVYENGSVTFASLSALPSVASGYCLMKMNASNGLGNWSYATTAVSNLYLDADVRVSPCGVIYQVMGGLHNSVVNYNGGSVTLGTSAGINFALGIVKYDFSGAMLTNGTINLAGNRVAISSTQKNLMVGTATLSTTITLLSGPYTITAGGWDALVAKYEDLTQPNTTAIITQPTITCYQSNTSNIFVDFNGLVASGTNNHIVWWFYYPGIPGNVTDPWIPAAWICAATGIAYQENLFGAGSFMVKNPPGVIIAVATVVGDCGSAVSNILVYNGCTNPVPWVGDIFRMSGPAFVSGSGNASFGMQPKLTTAVAPNPSADGVFTLSVSQNDGSISIPGADTPLPDPALYDDASKLPVPVMMNSDASSTERFIEVTDIYGRTVIGRKAMTNDQEQVDLSACQPGMYLLTIYSGNEKQTIRLIRQ